MTLLDEKMKTSVEANVNVGVAWYLTSSYAYYELDDPYLSDQAFDWLTKKLLANWDQLTHRHKEFLSLDILKAGTRPSGYPEIAISTATRTLNQIFREMKRKKKRRKK